MSKGYWYYLTCDGCFRRCRYRDFKVHSQGRASFTAVQSSLLVDSEDPEDWRYKRRRTVLGIMHSTKRELWKEKVKNCPHWGEVEIPKFDIGDLVKWPGFKRAKQWNEGTIVEILQPGQLPDASRYRGKYDLACNIRQPTKPRRRISYLVETNQSRNRYPQPALLWPRESYLEKLF